MIDFTYLQQPPKKWTFEQGKLKEWVENRCHGRVLNLFAGKVFLNVFEYRVDMSGEFSPDYVGDAQEYIQSCIITGMKYDTIILDPPYSLRKAREKYNGNYIGLFTKIKNLIPQILNDKGTVITLGYSSTGMSKSRGFEKKAICLVCHNGDHDDTVAIEEEYEKDLITVVEEKI